MEWLWYSIMKSSIESLGMQNMCPNEIRNKILREGIWESFTERMKNLLETQEKLWELYNVDSNLENKRKVLEDIVSLQPVIADWYYSSKKIIEIEGNYGVSR